MKNILLITSIYPLESSQNKGTPVCHYFAREWIKMGYRVTVIHVQAVYPLIFYWAAAFFREIIASKTNAIVYKKREKYITSFEMDSVSIHRIPTFKTIPHGRFKQKSLKNLEKSIIEIINQRSARPDYIIGHFHNPQLEIVGKLKAIFSAKSCIVMHENGYQIKKLYKNNYQKLISNIDVWGFRSVTNQRKFEELFGKQQRSFLCYSGVPDLYLNAIPVRDFSENIKNFIFVGEFIGRKYPVSLIPAIDSLFPDKDYTITYIGAGNEINKIKRIVDQKGIEKNIMIMGRVPRKEVIRSLDESDCLIMISKDEAFGLVYLEAMARGCITIGSRYEGIDGIIQHGVNGFLCEAGNSKELAEIIKHIKSLSTEEKQKISRNAHTSVKELTDYKVAQKYINAVINF